MAYWRPPSTPEQAFRFTPADLNANRNGVLPPGQRRWTTVGQCGSWPKMAEVGNVLHLYTINADGSVRQVA